MKKTIKTIIKPSRLPFKFGNCANIAIGQAFDIEEAPLKVILSVYEMSLTEGLSFHEATKVIKAMAKGTDKIVEYRSNITNTKYRDLVHLFNKGRFIYMFNVHLSFVEDGVIYDTHYFQAPGALTYIINQKPTGWWEIHDKPKEPDKDYDFILGDLPSPRFNFDLAFPRRSAIKPLHINL